MHDLTPKEKVLIRIQRSLTQKIVTDGILPLAFAPLTTRDKEPLGDWTSIKHLDIDVQPWIDDPEWINRNFGLKMSGVWVDIDIDSHDPRFHRCIQAAFRKLGIDIRLACGRSSRGVPSHYIVRLMSDELDNIDELKGFVPRQGVTINGKLCKVEVRISYPANGKKEPEKPKQTVAPGSILKDPNDVEKNDIVVWYAPGNVVAFNLDDMLTTDIRTASFRDLVKAITFGYMLYLIQPFWAEGNRHNAALALTGWLARAATSSVAGSLNEKLQNQVMFAFEGAGDGHTLIDLVCDECGDLEAYDRKRMFDSALSKLDMNPDTISVPGRGAIENAFGGEVASSLNSLICLGVELSPIAELKDRYIFCETTNEYLDRVSARKGLTFIRTVEHLHSTHSALCVNIKGKRVPAVTIFSHDKDRPTVDFYDMIPGSPDLSIIRFAPDCGYIHEDKPQQPSEYLVFNTFPGLSVKPVDTVDAALMAECRQYLDELLELLTSGNINQARWLMEWLSYTLNHPEDKQQIAPFIVGGQGTGKSFFGEVFLGTILGSLQQKAGSKELHGKYGVSYVKHKLLVFVDEVAFTAAYMVDQTKDLIRSSRISGQEKFKDPRTYNNFARFLFTANRYDVGLTQQDTKDRAIFLIKAYDAKRLSLSPSAWDQWRYSKIPFFEKFADFLKKDNVSGHFVRMLMDLNPTRKDVESIEFSCAHDAQFAESNMSIVRHVIHYCIEDCCIAGFDLHIDNPFTQKNCIDYVFDVAKKVANGRVDALKVFAELKDMDLIERVGLGKYRTKLKIGSLANDFYEKTGVAVNPRWKLTDDDYGPNTNDGTEPPRTLSARRY